MRCQLQEGRQRTRRRGSKGAGKTETHRIGQMMRRLREWKRRIPLRYHTAADALIADRLGVGITEGYYWEWESAEAGYTEVLRRLHERNEPIKSGRMTPQQKKHRIRPGNMFRFGGWDAALGILYEPAA